jgi:hypothetical protein
VLALVYSSESVFLVNISDVPQNVSTLRFEQEGEDNTVIRFSASAWAATGMGSLTALQPEACYQLVTRLEAAGALPSGCSVFLGYIQRNASGQFWLPLDSAAEEFTILQGSRRIAECEIDARRCEFALP